MKEEENISGTLEIGIKRAMNLPSMDMVGASDPFCVFQLYDVKELNLKQNEVIILFNLLCNFLITPSKIQKLIFRARKLINNLA